MWVLSMELNSCHPFGTWNFEVAHRFLENLRWRVDKPYLYSVHFVILRCTFIDNYKHYSDAVWYTYSGGSNGFTFSHTNILVKNFIIFFPKDIFIFDGKCLVNMCLHTLEL